MISFGLLVLIWMIQILHYPLFELLDEALFQTSMTLHQARISYLVIPLMLTELMLAIGLCWLKPHALTFTGLALVLLIWLSTFFLQVPLHQKLTTLKNPSALKALIKSNWLRTCLWTLKFVICAFQLTLKE